MNCVLLFQVDAVPHVHDGPRRNLRPRRPLQRLHDRREGRMHLRLHFVKCVLYFPCIPVGVCAGFPAAVGAVHLFDLVVPGDALRDAARAAVHRLRERHPRHGQTGGRGESSKSMSTG